MALESKTLLGVTVLPLTSSQPLARNQVRLNRTTTVIQARTKVN